MKNLGEDVLPNTERTRVMAEAEDPWQTLAARAKAIGDHATTAAYHTKAYDASEQAAREYDMVPEIDRVSERVMTGIEGIEQETASPYYADGQRRVVNGGETGEFYAYIDGTNLVHPLGRDERGGVKFEPDAEWEAACDKIVALATHGDPKWHEDQLPNMRTWNEMEGVYAQRPNSYWSSLDPESYEYKTLRDKYGYAVNDYNRVRDQFTVRRTPTTMGVDLLYISNTDGSRRFLMAQKPKVTQENASSIESAAA